MTKHSKADVERATEFLKRCYPKGATVYTILRQVSRTGMSRQISLVSIQVDEGDSFMEDESAVAVLHPNWATSVILGLALTPTETGYDAVKIGGCGMDMGYEIAYRLGQALYGDGYALKHRWL